MDAGALDKLHDTRYEHVYAVAYGIDLDFLANNILINKHGLFLAYVNGAFQISAKRSLIGNDLHRSAAQHERRTYKHGISDL